jgi:hypothetical protein
MPFSHDLPGPLDLSGRKLSLLRLLVECETFPKLSVCFYIIYASAKTNVEHVGFLHVWRQSRYKAHGSLGLVDWDPGLIIATNPITWCHYAAQI